MNTKFLFVLILVALVSAACAPAIVDGVAPLAKPVPAAQNEPSVLVPVTSNSAAPAARDAQASRRWSGEIFLSDTDSPDLKANNTADSQTSAECTAEDSQPKRHGGCTE